MQVNGQHLDSRTMTFDNLQWPAMAITILAAWMVASPREQRRHYGFWVFLASNVLWIAWGCIAAYALVLLQVFLAVMNVRGSRTASA